MKTKTPGETARKWLNAVDEVLERHGAPTTGTVDGYSLENEITAYGAEQREAGAREMRDKAMDEASDAVLEVFEKGMDACIEAVVDAIRALPVGGDE